jgi:histidinol-phosphate aminotransferase
VTPFNGADAGIRAVFDAYGRPGDTFITTSPTFGYYEPCARLTGLNTLAIPYEDDLAFPLRGFEDALAAGSGRPPRLAFICNPNNPTGTLLPPEQLLALATQHPDTLFVIDELYAPFSKSSVLPRSLALDNVAVLQSMSKAAGIAGVRIGYMIAHASITERIHRVTGPYDINSVAVLLAKAAVADADATRNYVDEVMRAKATTLAALENENVRTYAGHGNYILVWPPGDCDDVCARLKDKGILVRNMRGKALIAGSFRLTIGTQAQMEEFVASFRQVLASMR